MKRVAAYCRVSTDRDDQANSFESQQRYFREYIERHPDMVLQEIYADEGISGTSTRKRARFNAMIQAAREGKLDLIVTKEVSRFARNTMDTLRYTRELKAIGVGVRFLLDNIDTLSAEGEFRLTIMSSVAQEESHKTSERVKWGQTQRMRQGVVFGGSLLGYDVAGGRMSVNPEGAAIVREIFRKYTDERKGAPTIARELRDAGVLSGKGKCLWSAATVLKILKNEKYCGDLVQKKTYTPDFLTHDKQYNRGQEQKIVLRDHHKPIIDRETFDRVQRELDRRRTQAQSSGHGNRYPLSGKIRCGCCGSSFQARKRRCKDGCRRVWRCGRATAEGQARISASGAAVGCSIGRQLREDIAQELLRRSVQAVQLDAGAVAESLARIVEEVRKSSQDDEAVQKRRIERELETALERKSAALEAFLAKSISREDFCFVNERCDREIAACRERLNAAGRREPDTGGKLSGLAIRAGIRAIVSGERADEAFYGMLLDHMTVYADGRVEVCLKRLLARWTYVPDGSAAAQEKTARHCESTVPISVSKPFSSG